MDLLFSSVIGYTESSAASVSAGGFLICTVASLALGLACALIYMYKTRYSKGFVVTLALLPVMVQMVILLVNGNLGAGIAVMGVFNLVRFRSAPGSAKDIGSVFMAMAIGLATGMGYVGVAVLLCAVVAVANIAYANTSFGEAGRRERQLKITVPEDLQYEGVFDGVLSRYAESFELVRVETTNMGSLFQLTYALVLPRDGREKAMIDELRCLNGNLKIAVGLMPAEKEVL